MIFDKESMFSDQQAITGSAVSESVIDLGAPGTPMHAAGAITQDLGRGRDMAVRIQVTEDFNTLTSLKIAVEVDDAEGFGSAEEVASVSVALADLKAGYVTPIAYMPRGVDKRYVRLNYTVTGTDPTTGKVTAGLVFGNETWVA